MSECKELSVWSCVDVGFNTRRAVGGGRSAHVEPASTLLVVCNRGFVALGCKRCGVCLDFREPRLFMFAMIELEGLWIECTFVKFLGLVSSEAGHMRGVGSASCLMRVSARSWLSVWSCEVGFKSTAGGLSVV